MKNCTKCGLERELGEFYRDKRHKDGLASWCKECHCKATWQKTNPERYRAYMREYNRKYNRLKQAEKARYYVGIEVRQGNILKKTCEICGCQKTYAHHPFYQYYKPLNVVWLCAKHHNFIHKYEKIVTPPDFKERVSLINSFPEKIEKTIDFYLTYHKVPELAKTMIKGNLMVAIEAEYKLLA